jgi:hypothetical protein
LPISDWQHRRLLATNHGRLSLDALILSNLLNRVLN